MKKRWEDFEANLQPKFIELEGSGSGSGSGKKAKESEEEKLKRKFKKKSLGDRLVAEQER